MRTVQRTQLRLQRWLCMCETVSRIHHPGPCQPADTHARITVQPPSLSASISRTLHCMRRIPPNDSCPAFTPPPPPPPNPMNKAMTMCPSGESPAEIFGKTIYDIATAAVVSKASLGCSIADIETSKCNVGTKTPSAARNSTAKQCGAQFGQDNIFGGLTCHISALTISCRYTCLKWVLRSSK